MNGGSFQVDPLSPQVHHPWEVRNLPTITWNGQSSHYFTLVIYDVGMGSTHAVYMNIPGHDISSSDVSFFTIIKCSIYRCINNTHVRLTELKYISFSIKLIVRIRIMLYKVGKNVFIDQRKCFCQFQMHIAYYSTI